LSFGLEEFLDLIGALLSSLPSGPSHSRRLRGSQVPAGVGIANVVFLSAPIVVESEPPRHLGEPISGRENLDDDLGGDPLFLSIAYKSRDALLGRPKTTIASGATRIVGSPFLCREREIAAGAAGNCGGIPERSQ